MTSELHPIVILRKFQIATNAVVCTRPKYFYVSRHMQIEELETRATFHKSIRVQWLRKQELLSGQENTSS